MRLLILIPFLLGAKPIIYLELDTDSKSKQLLSELNRDWFNGSGKYDTQACHRAARLNTLYDYIHKNAEIKISEGWAETPRIKVTKGSKWQVIDSKVFIRSGLPLEYLYYQVQLELFDKEKALWEVKSGFGYDQPAPPKYHYLHRLWKHWQPSKPKRPVCPY